MCQSSLKSSGTGLSHDDERLHVSWNKSLAGRMAGAKSPNTSNTPAVAEAMRRLVAVAADGGISGTETWKQSVLTSQWRPRAFGDLFGGWS